MGSSAQVVPGGATVAHPYNHKEAFALMWYACQCGHRERIWNSRDGVTPFGMNCPSCGQLNMQHVQWHLDRRDPTHTPLPGQRIWVSMTLDRAHAMAAARIAFFKAQGHPDLSEARVRSLVASIYRDGLAPDLVVTGYQEVRNPSRPSAAPDDAPLETTEAEARPWSPAP